ncbi:MAG: hypothetical protein QW680_14340 [Pyrobaculum sp.]
MENLLKSGILLLLIAVVLSYLASFICLVFYLQEIYTILTLYDLIILSVEFLLIFSGVVYIYNYIRGKGSPMPIYVFSIILGVLTIGVLHEIFGILLILAPVLAMIRIRTDIDRLLRYIALSLGIFGYLSMPQIYLPGLSYYWVAYVSPVMPLNPMWLLLLGVAILFYGFLQFISEKLHIEVVTRIIGNLLAAATAALLSLNLLDIYFVGDWRDLFSVAHVLYGLGGLLLIPPLVSYIFKPPAEEKAKGLAAKETPPEASYELEVKPYVPTREEDEETRIRR